MTQDNKIICLLSAMVREITTLRGEVRRGGGQDKIADEPSDGMVAAFRVMAGDKKLPEDLWDLGLSVRARRALVRTNIRYVSEIKPEAFANSRGCGKKTIDELMELKATFESIINQTPNETGTT